MLSRRQFVACTLAMPLAGRAFAAAPDVFATHGIAIHGTDPVAYFTQNQAVMGDAGMSLMWRGAVWNFASEDNRYAFEMDPLAYVPQYGGYCAYAMSKGAIATSVPEAWTIHEDKLYLNFSTGVRQIWRQDIPQNVALADGFWPGILAGDAGVVN